MTAIREYLLSVIGTAVLCSIVNTLAARTGTAAGAIKMLTGTVLALAVISPLLNISLDHIHTFADGVEAEADAVVASGENYARQAMADIITDRTRAYILDKAEALGARIDVTVRLDGSNMPAGMTISGSASPYARQELSETIAQDLGIPTEAQIWNLV